MDIYINTYIVTHTYAFVMPTHKRLS